MRARQHRIEPCENRTKMAQLVQKLGPFLRKSKWVDSAKLMRLRPADSAKLPRLRSACCTKIQSPCNMQTTPTQQSALEFYSLIILWVMNSEFCM